MEEAFRRMEEASRQMKVCRTDLEEAFSGSKVCAADLELTIRQFKV